MGVIGSMYEHGERFWKANPHPTWVRLDGVTYHKTGIAPREMDPEVVPATARVDARAARGDRAAGEGT